MKKFAGFVTFLVLLGNVLMLLALSFHVILAPGKFALVAKDHLTLIDTYRDVRQWNPTDVASHPALLARLTDAGRLDLVSHISSLPTAASHVQTSTATVPVGHDAGPAMVPGINVPASLVTEVQAPAKSTSPTNPLVKAMSAPLRAASPTTKPSAARSADTKSIFDFGR